MMGAAAKDPRLPTSSRNSESTRRRSQVNVDRNKAKAIGVSLNDIFQTMEVELGSLYVNNFTYLNRSWQVVVQADAPFRNNVASLGRFTFIPARPHRHVGRARTRSRRRAAGRGDERDHRDRRA